LSFRIPLCLFNRHEPDRREAAWDGRHFTGTCIHCKARIRRASRGKWLKDWKQEE
jgi:hypothetical protein